jgi:Insertion element 4 transposase N-terminal/Transposase DDE domain
VLAGAVPRDVVDTAVAECGRGAKRSGGKLPPHVMVYFTMALALFADDDYEEVITRLAEPLTAWGCWDGEWEIPTSGGLTQARARLGFEPLAEVFEQVAVPVATELTRGAWLGDRRLVAVDGFVWDAPDTTENVAAFGRGSGGQESAFAQVRVVTVSECGSHAVIGAAMGAVVGPKSGEQTLARGLYPQLDSDMLLIADRGFYSFADWKLAADTGTALLWRVAAGVGLPLVGWCDDGSYLALLVDPKIRGTARDRLLAAARAGQDVDERKARLVRVIQYEVTDRDGAEELICLITTIVDPADAGAAQLAGAYQERWEHETGNDQLKTHLRGPGRVLRSKSPDMVRAEIYGYLLTHYAISALICRAATEADIDPDRVKFLRTVRLIRRRIADPAAFSP